MTVRLPDGADEARECDDLAALPVAAPSLQYDLFARFLGASELSNTIELWDAIPKYSFSARMQALARDSAGRLPIYQRVFEHHPAPKAETPTWICSLVMQPAVIEVDGRWTDVFPSADEELVEEVLRKIFVDQSFGLHDAARGESWVRFTLHMIRVELARRGRTRSIAEIKRSLEVLSKTVLDVTVSGRGVTKVVYTNTILSDLTRVTRAEWLDDPSAMWMARLPGLISASINTLSYRQFNYGVLMSLDAPLSRWLHKRLSHEYTNAHLTSPYKILFSTIARDSGLLHNCRISANLKAVERVLAELVDRRVLMMADVEVRRSGRKVRDALYTLTPHMDFVAEIKAANLRASEARAKAVAARVIEPPTQAPREGGLKPVRPPLLRRTVVAE